MKRRIVLAFAALLSAAAAAGPLALPAAPDAGLQQRPGAALPLDLPLRDDLGQPVRLRDYLHAGQPVLLVPGYYHCTQLCGLLMHGLLEALQQTGLPRTKWRIVGVSIAPDDQPVDARRRREADLAYASFLAGAKAAPADLHLDLLVAGADGAHRLAQAIGYRYEKLAPVPGQPTQYAHPATVIVATPEGRVSRYFNGVQFDPKSLRLALVDASGGSIGSISDRIALLCAHFDPSVGRFSNQVMLATRVAGALTVLALAFVAWRHRPQGGRR